MAHIATLQQQFDLWIKDMKHHLPDIESHFGIGSDYI